MDCNKYLAVRRAYNQIRQDSDVTRRLTFPEFATLCHLVDEGARLSVSQIAKYQDTLRPTMTHRAKRLRSLGYIECAQGDQDRRKVMCEVTELGRSRVEELCRICSNLARKGMTPLHVSASRMRYYVDGMGTLACDSGDLVLLATKIMEPKGCFLSDIIELLRLMQPTASMAVASLEKSGLLCRRASVDEPRRSQIFLTDKGQERVGYLTEQIADIVIPRKKARRDD